MNSSYSPHRLGCAIAAAVVAFAALLSLALVGQDDGPPSCPVSRTGSVDIVPAGVRPCVLYGAGKTVLGDDSVVPAVPGGTLQKPKTPKTSAPKAPAVKVPAAPRPPSRTTRR